MTRARPALIVLLLAFHSIVAPLMAFTVRFSCTLSSTPADGVTDIGGSVTMSVDVYDVIIEGLPDGEAPDENSLRIDYRWLTGKHPEEGVPAMTVRKEGGTTFTVSDGSNGIDGPGNYAVRCEIKVRITIDGEPDESEWTEVCTRDARFVAVASLHCGNLGTDVSTQGNQGASTSYSGNTAIVCLPAPCNGGDATATVTATPTPSGPWPSGKPVWSGDVLSSSGATATVDTSTPGVRTVTATCGNRASLKIVVFKLNLQADSNGDGNVTDADDEVEMLLPGVVAVANDGDADADEILDNSDMQIGGQNSSFPQLFTPVQLKMESFPYQGNIRIHFQYEAASTDGQQPPNGSLRLWKRQSSELRIPQPANDGGDFIVPDSDGNDAGYTPEQLGMQVTSVALPGSSLRVGSCSATFWMEATAPVQNSVIRVTVEDCVNDSTVFDEIKVTALSLQPLLVEASFTGGAAVPAERRTTFGLPLVVNNDHDGDSSDNPNEYYRKDCDDEVVNGRSDLEDMGRLSFPALPASLPATGTVQLSFTGGTVRIFEDNSEYALAGTNSIGLSESELYAKLMAGSLSYRIEAVTPGIVMLKMGINRSPMRPVAVIRNIAMTREFVTHNPEFEKKASLSNTDNCQQRELMRHLAIIELQSLPACYGNVTAKVYETYAIDELMGSIALNQNGILHLRLQEKYSPTNDYEQIWLEAGTGGANETFAPLNGIWSHPDRDVRIKIYLNP